MIDDIFSQAMTERMIIDDLPESLVFTIKKMGISMKHMVYWI